MNSKAKGGGFEREVAKTLTDWFFGEKAHLQEYAFWRTSNSGGTATISPGNKNISGDIMAIKPEIAWFCDKFTIEAKCGYGDGSFDKVLKGNKSDPIRGFWEQVNRDAETFGKEPLLIYRKKGFPVIIGFKRSFIEPFNITLPSISVKYEGMDEIQFFNLYPFLNSITPYNLCER